MTALCCKEIEATGYDEYRCRLSGASVELNCRALDDDPCIPRQALMVRAGSLSIKDVSRDEREAVRTMADRMAGQATMTGGVTDVSVMRPEELDRLQQRLADRRRQIRDGERQRQRLLPRLVARFDKLVGKKVALTVEIEALDTQIEAIREGRPVELTPIRKGRVLSEKQKAAMRENAKKARAAGRAKRGNLTDAERREKMRTYQREYKRRKTAEKRKAA